MLFKVQCLAQGPFDKDREGDSDTNIIGQPDLPHELQVPYELHDYKEHALACNGSHSSLMYCHGNVM